MTLEEPSMPVVEDPREDGAAERVHLACLERAFRSLVRSGWRMDPAGD